MCAFEYTFEDLQRLFDKPLDWISHNAFPIDLDLVKSRWKPILDEAINFVKESWYQQPTPLSNRQVHYRLIHVPYLEYHGDRDYDYLVDYLVRCRITGLIDWIMLSEFESLIAEEEPTGGIDPEEIIKEALENAEYATGINPWREMGKYVVVITEKRELHPQLEWVCKKYYVRLVCCKGETPWSRLYREAERMLKKIKEGFDVQVEIVTDHDPTGLEIQRFIMAVLYNWFKVDVKINRLMLTHKQVESYKLPPYEPSTNDKRTKFYTKIFGNEAWEVDALQRDRMQIILERRIRDVRNWKSWDGEEKRNQETRERVRELAEKLLKK